MKSNPNSAEDFFIQPITRFCAYRERSIYEVKLKLKQLGATATQIDSLINWLKDHNYLNQKRFEEALVRSKVNQNKWGRKKIQSALLSSGTNDFEALKLIDEEKYTNNLISILQKKKDELAQKRDEKAFQKLIRFALSKGFTYEEIHKAMKIIDSGADNDFIPDND